MNDDVYIELQLQQEYFIAKNNLSPDNDITVSQAIKLTLTVTFIGLIIIFLHGFVLLEKVIFVALV